MSLRYSLLLILVTVISYLPGLPGGFIYDDYWNILDNASIKNSALSLSSALDVMSTGTAGPLGRPLPMLSFYLNYHINGFSPLGFKLVNIAIHALNAFLIFIVVSKILNYLTGRGKIPGDRLSVETAAFWVALLWAIHPINLTSILYVVQRMTSMAATFTLMGIYTYLRLRSSTPINPGRMILGLSAVIFFGLLAALCKENGALLFVFLLVIECFIFRWKAEIKTERQVLYGFYGLVIVLPICLALYATSFNDLLRGYENEPFDLKQRILTEPRIIWFYISQILLPKAHLFNLYHDNFPVSMNLWEPITTLLSILGLVMLVVVGIISASRVPWLGFGILFFLSGHSMESTIIPLDLVYEHRNYVPSIGLLVIMVLAVYAMFSKFKSGKHNVFLCILTILFVSITASRAYDWHNNVLLAERIAQRNPDSVDANYELGHIYMRLFRSVQNPVFSSASIAAFERAYSLGGPRKLEVNLVLIHVRSIFGLPEEQLRINQVASDLRSEKIDPKVLVALRHFVNCRVEKECNSQVGTYKKLFMSLISNPSLKEKMRDDALYIYSMYLATVPGEAKEALKFIRDVVSRNPDNLAYKVQLVSVLLTNGEEDEAVRLMETISRRYGTRWKLVGKQ